MLICVCVCVCCSVASAQLEKHSSGYEQKIKPSPKLKTRGLWVKVLRSHSLIHYLYNQLVIVCLLVKKKE